MIRIAITGAECSGKSTLSEMLANRLGVGYVPEMSRIYLDDLGRAYEQEDLDHIATKQQMMIDARGASMEDYLITDTEMLVMKIWSEEKYGTISEHIKFLFFNQFFDIYLLCKPDIPYVADHQRENPEDRDRLYEIYKSNLQEMGAHFIEIRGSYQERLEQAIEAISMHKKYEEKLSLLRTTLGNKKQIPLDFLDLVYMFERIAQSWADVADLVQPIYNE